MGNRLKKYPVTSGITNMIVVLVIDNISAANLERYISVSIPSTWRGKASDTLKIP